VLGTVVPERVVAVDGLDTVVLCERQSNCTHKNQPLNISGFRCESRESKGDPMGTAEGTTHPIQTCRPCTRGTTRPGHRHRHAGQP
jgi:hypothetical protein